jgi:hypothetical protein
MLSVPLYITATANDKGWTVSSVINKHLSEVRGNDGMDKVCFKFLITHYFWTVKHQKRRAKARRNNPQRDTLSVLFYEDRLAIDISHFWN